MAHRMEHQLAYPGWQIASRPEKRYELVGQSARLRQVLRLAAKLGRGNWPVLLLGETGTGKELVARTIHRAQPAAPFVVVDCTTMSGTLMESELFGHVKGAFTGATANKVGLLEEADGGTAFFDEIGELPLDLQAKLLRVLQEKEFRPGRRHLDAALQLPCDRRDESRLGERSGGRALPPGSLLSAQRRLAAPGPAARS